MKMQYFVDMGPLWRYDSIKYVNFPADADSLISKDSANSVIRNGDPFDLSSLENERQHLASSFSGIMVITIIVRSMPHIWPTLFLCPERCCLDCN